MTVTAKGKTHAVDWCWLLSEKDELMLQIKDARGFSEIAADFEGAETIYRESDTEGNKTYTGYTRMQRMIRKVGGYVVMVLTKE